MMGQSRLVAAADRIRQSIGRDAPGYAGIILEQSEVVVWWRGPLPHSVAVAVAAARRDVRVRVAGAAHSRAELTAAAAPIRADLRANPHSPFFGIEIAVNGSGITVDADAATVGVRSLAAPSRWAVPASVPVSVKYAPRPTTTTRMDDSPGYWGGGRINNNDNNAFCTAGFPVLRDGTEFMLTAGHCGRVGGSWNNGNDVRFFGDGVDENIGHDLLLIRADTGPLIWDGPAGDGTFTKSIAASQFVFANEFLCASGSVSGAICNYKVGTNFQSTLCDFDAYNTFECYDDLVTAIQQDGRTAAMKGDSGGPVFSLTLDDRVIAKGTITGRGGSTLFFQDFATAKADFGITIQTG
jgi:hypothetical protein